MTLFGELEKLFTSNENRLSYIAGRFGLAHQMEKLEEEMEELKEAMERYSDKPSDEDNENSVIEEMADVSILLAQILLLLDYHNERCDHSVEVGYYNQVVSKIDRTIERINSGYYEKLKEE